MARILPLGVLAWLLLVVPGCCGCKTYRVEFERTESLEDTYAVPVDIYFAPPEDVEELRNVTNAEWFSGRREELLRTLEDESRGTMLVSATPTGREPPIVRSPLREVERILVWGALPERSARDKPPTSINPEELETRSMGIFVSGECSFVVILEDDKITYRRAGTP